MKLLRLLVDSTYIIKNVKFVKFWAKNGVHTPILNHACFIAFHTYAPGHVSWLKFVNPRSPKGGTKRP